MNTHYLAQTKTGKNFVCSVAFADKHVAALRNAGAIRLRMVNLSEFPNSSTTAESAVVDRKFTVDQPVHITLPSGKVVYGRISTLEPMGFYGVYVNDILFPITEGMMTACDCVHDAPVTVPTQDAVKPQNEAVLPQKWRYVERMSDLTKGQTVMTYDGVGTLKHAVNDGWWWVELSPRKFMIARWEYLQVVA